jgi:hypothetical protein
MDEYVYWWTFEIKGDVINFTDTQIQVSATTYKAAIAKVKALKIPTLERNSDIEDNLKLTSVIEDSLVEDELVIDREEE